MNKSNTSTEFFIKRMQGDINQINSKHSQVEATVGGWLTFLRHKKSGNREAKPSES